jgi:uncharacterized protein
MAILGILMVNIAAFAMPDVVHDNPAAFGDLTGANFTVWRWTHLLFEFKFHTIFAALFGAGLVLMLDRASHRSMHPLTFHYRRMVGLLLIGMAHAYLLWYGDILVAYALCGCFVVWLRNLRTAFLVPLAFAMLLVPAFVYLGIYGLVVAFPEYATQPLMDEWWPSAEAVAADVAAYQGSWLDQMPTRARSSLAMQTLVFAIFTFWRASGLMLLGIVLFRIGVLTGARSTRFYLATFFTTLITGLAIVEAGARGTIAHEWDPRYVLPIGFQFNYWGSLLVAMAWICALVLLARSSRSAYLTTGLAAIGKTALSNYLMQSLICTYIFYGHGLGWYGETPRTTQLLIVLCIGALQLIVSPLWLRFFRFGPVEFLWRSMTYGQLPRMRNIPVAIDQGAPAT